MDKSHMRRLFYREGGGRGASGVLSVSGPLAIGHGWGTEASTLDNFRSLVCSKCCKRLPEQVKLGDSIRSQYVSY